MLVRARSAGSRKGYRAGLRVAGPGPAAVQQPDGEHNSNNCTSGDRDPGLEPGRVPRGEQRDHESRVGGDDQDADLPPYPVIEVGERQYHGGEPDVPGGD